MNPIQDCNQQIGGGANGWKCRNQGAEPCAFCGKGYCRNHMRKRVCPRSPDTSLGKHSHITREDLGLMRNPRYEEPRTVQTKRDDQKSRRVLVLTRCRIDDGDDLNRTYHDFHQQAGRLLPATSPKGWEMDLPLRLWLQEHIGERAMTMEQRWRSERQAVKDLQQIMEWEWRKSQERT